MPRRDHGDEEICARWQAADELLANRFGHPKLMPAQRSVIDRVLRGHNVLGVLPTGHGKSLCYQLPSQILPGLTVVVSPLVSLMKDQCDSLAAKGIVAVRIDQSLSSDEFQRAWQSIHAGRVKLLYLAPERFFHERFPAQLDGRAISLLAIDEAHCMSQWGHHFRPDYLRLPELIDRFRIPQTLALTATATRAVVRDIRKAFAIDATDTVRRSTHRANLRLLCTQVASDQRDALLLDRLGGANASRPTRRRRRLPTIIYVTRRRTAEQLAQTLRDQGLQPLVYHGGLAADERERVQQEFLASRDAVLIGTIAFGMGVDKPDIRRIIHYNPSQSIEAYSQEVGRGGRDGKACECETLLVVGDQTALINLAASDLPSDDSLHQLIERLVGQPDRFYLALGKLGWEVNLSTPAVATTLVQLQTLGYLRCLPMRYDTYRITPKYTSQATLDRCESKHRDAVAALLASLTKGRRGFRVNLVVAAEQYQIDRASLLNALEQTAIAGLWDVTSADSMHGYEWVRRITAKKRVIAALRRHAFEQYDLNVQRVADMMQFLECRECLAIVLARHFGHARSRPCGRCSACLQPERERIETTAMESIGSSATTALRRTMDQHPDLFSEPLDQAKFLCGLSTPRFRRFRIATDPGYGICEDVPFGRVLAALQPA